MTIVWNAQRVSEGLKEIAHARPIVSASVKQLLDKYHGLQGSERYYDILLGDWIERYLHLIYVATQDFAARADSLIASDDLVKHVLIKPKSDSAEFFSAHQSLPVVALNALRAIVLSGASSISIFDGEIKIKNAMTLSRRDKVIGSFLKLFSIGSSPKILFVKPFSGRMPGLWVSTMLSWRKWAIHDDLDFAFSVRTKVDANWRSMNLSSISSGAGLGEIANAMLTAFVPVCFVEGFQELKEQINQARPQRFENIYSAQALWTHLAFKMLAAQWCEQGTKLHYHQHGGWYGSDEVHVGELYESRVADIYYTWGWSRGASNSQPLSPVTPRLRSTEKTYDSLICFDQPSQIYRLQYFPLPGTLQTMYDQTADFVRERESNTILKVRLFAGEYGSVQKDLLLNSGKEMTIDNSEKIFDQYAASRLVVHNYLGTSWLETIGNNIPTICFYDIDAYRFRSDAKALLEDLVKVGILHLSGTSAAEHANEINNDVNGWWSREEVQTARQNFASQFANYSADWKQSWEKNFMHHLSS